MEIVSKFGSNFAIFSFISWELKKVKYHSNFAQYFQGSKNQDKSVIFYAFFLIIS